MIRRSGLGTAQYAARYAANTLCRKGSRSVTRHGSNHGVPGISARHAARIGVGQPSSVSTTGQRPVAPDNRSHTMHLLIEELSRDRMRQAQRDLEAIRLARRLRASRKREKAARAV